MKILEIGGTKFFGIHMVKELLKKGHDVTIATRGLAADDFGIYDTPFLVYHSTEASSLVEKDDYPYEQVLVGDLQ